MCNTQLFAQVERFIATELILLHRKHSVPDPECAAVASFDRIFDHTCRLRRPHGDIRRVGLPGAEGKVRIYRFRRERWVDLYSIISRIYARPCIGNQADRARTKAIRYVLRCESAGWLN